ncbi:DUF2726 domain-containing protein [Zobellella iuensis]|uniref:DUF2726 domain-containing protein n=1 Tax=Zobellella iuensis TaxID=2803811 RepID=A0ABS1QTX7_9GAMM|nr:DUF2726 domain-containing protein [Zobellella iuensis]MBL1378327.1 DUF2726 domain-containing protein [Zobellella iuensis]
MTDLLPVSLLDWLMFSLAALLVLLVSLGLLRRLWRGTPKQPYRQRLLFSPEAASALRLLDSALGRELRVFAAVRLSDLLELNPVLKKAHREQAWHELYGERLDFVLCSPKDLKVRVGVMLVDDSLSKTDGRQRQRLLQHISEAGLPLVHLSPKDWPSPEALRQEILDTISQRPFTQSPTGRGRVEPVIRLSDEALPEDNDEPRFRL